MAEEEIKNNFKENVKLQNEMASNFGSQLQDDPYFLMEDTQETRECRAKAEIEVHEKMMALRIDTEESYDDGDQSSLRGREAQVWKRKDKNKFNFKKIISGGQEPVGRWKRLLPCPCQSQLL